MLVVDRALHGLARRAGVAASDLARVLRLGLVGSLADPLGVEPGGDGHVLLGLYPGVRRVVRVCGLELRVPLSDALGLSPNNVTVVHRMGGRTVKVCHDVRFGRPEALRHAALRLGLPLELGVDAVEVALRELGRLSRPHAVVAAIYFADHRGWDLYRFLQVVPRVVDPERHLDLRRAREFEADSDYGDMVGVSLPTQDWLTPVLCWAGGAG